MHTNLDPHALLHGAFYTALGTCVSVGVDHGLIGSLYFLLGLTTFLTARR